MRTAFSPRSLTSKLSPLVTQSITSSLQLSMLTLDANATSSTQPESNNYGPSSEGLHVCRASSRSGDFTGSDGNANCRGDEEARPDSWSGRHAAAELIDARDAADSQGDVRMMEWHPVEEAMLSR